MPISKRCKYCRKAFTVPPSVRAQRFCSKPCRFDYENGPPDLIRQCSKCKEEYPATAEFFRPQIRSKQGIDRICVYCQRRRSIEYNKRKPEKRKIGVENYRRNHAENIKAKKALHYERNRDVIIAKARHYRKSNPNYFRRDPLLGRVKSAKRRKRLLASPSQHTQADILQKLSDQERKCYYCQVELIGTAFHVDHYIPISKGGTNGPENIVIACAFCNLSKGDRMPDVFIAKLKMRQA